MNDDFDNNNDDLSWLQDDEPVEEPDDDQDLDWQQDEPSADTSQPGRTGFTSELSWRQDFDDLGDDDSGKDDDLFDWQRESSGDEGQGRAHTGLTGHLDWLGGDSGESAGDEQFDDAFADFPDETGDTGELPPGDEVPPWLRGVVEEQYPELADDQDLTDWPQDDTGDQRSVPQSEHDEEVPDWLRGAVEDDEETAPQEDEAMPSWMQGADSDEFAAVEPEADEVPQWLQGVVGQKAPDETPPDDSEEAVPDWIQQTDNSALSEAASFDESEKLPDDVPPWLAGEAARADTQQPEGAGSFPGDLLDEFEGDFVDEFAAEPSDDDFDVLRDLFGDEEPAAADADMPDWFDEEEEAASVPEPKSGFDDMDFEDMFAEPADEELPDFGDLIGDSLTTGDLSGDFDLDEFTAEADEEFGESEAFDDLEEIEAEPVSNLDIDSVGLDDEAFEDIFGEEVEDVLSELAPDQGDALDFAGFDDEAALDDLGELDLDAFDDEAMLDDILDDEDEAEAVQMDTDYLREMGIGPSPAEEEAERDWFAEGDTGSDLDWLEELGELGEITDLEEAAAEPAGEDWLDELEIEGAEPDLAAQIPEDLSEQEIDSFLATLGDSEAELPKTGDLALATNAEFEDLFAEGAFDTLEKDVAPDSEEAPELPEWLTDLSVSAGSATAIVRKRDERPLEELPERLQELAERGEQLPPTPAEIKPTGELKAILTGVEDTLPLIPQETRQSEMIAAPLLTAEQQNRAQMLQALVGEGLEAEAVDVKRARAKARRSRPSRFRIDRLLIALLAVTAAVLPFFINSLNIGNLPPRHFAAGSDQETAFDLIDSLEPGQLVLVGIEYGPTTAAELDSATDAVLHHILAKGARPVLLGSNAVGLLHASNVIDAIGAEDDAPFLTQIGRTSPFAANQDYYVVRYVTASIVGLRTIEQDSTRLLETDIHGDPTGLGEKSLSDFGLIVVIAENAEDMRAWAEQVLSSTDASLVIVTSYAAEPLSRPYFDALSLDGKAAGMLVGYRDAYTYREQVDTLVYGELPTPTQPPTEIPPTTQPVEVENTATPVPAQGTAAATEPMGATEIPVTPSATPTVESSPTPTLTATPTVTSTATPSPTPTFTATPTPLPIAVVNATQAVNVRSGPGTTFAPILALSPGTEVLVLGLNEDETWVNIMLGDGREGWISATLLDIQQAEPVNEDPTPTPETLKSDPSSKIIVKAGPITRFKFALQDEPTPTPETFEPLAVEASPTPTMTATPTTTPSVEVTPEATEMVAAVVVERPERPYKDERWYAMTLGVVLAVIIIASGNIFNILRSLFRRDRA